MRFGIGQPVTRKEDARFLTGQGRYVADIDLVRQSHAVFLFSPHAHAQIRSVDKSAAEQVPGVYAVLTGEDWAADGLGSLDPEAMPEDMGGPKGFRTKRPPLAQGRVRYVGERVAVVIAATEAIARDAAELVAVDYEILPAAVTVEAAVRPGAPLVHDGVSNNTSFTMRLGNGDAADAAFARAHHVTRLSLYNNRLTAVTMEPRGCIADYDPGTRRYLLYSSTQNVHGVRQTLAHHILHVPESRIRVVARDVGGGFGMKGNVYPEEAILVWAARRVGRPVKWIPTRSEALLGDYAGRDQNVGRRIGARRRRQIPGPALDRLAQYRRLYRGRRRHPDHLFAKARLNRLRYPGGVGHEQSRFHQYRADRALSRRRPPRGCLHHGAPRRSGSARDAHRSGGIAQKEPDPFRRLSLSDAHRLDLRHRELRRGDGQMPSPCRLGRLRRSTRRTAKPQANCAAAASPTMSTIPASLMSAWKCASIRRAKLTILAGTLSHGQGHETTYAQMVGDWLGVAEDKIHLAQADTDEVAIGRGTYASRSMMIGGSALRAAADEVIERGKRFAAHFMEADAADISFADGAFTISGTDRSMPIGQVAQMSFIPVGLPSALGVGLQGAGAFNSELPSFPNGCHICELEVDPETGAVELDRYTVVDDCGTVINPLLAKGQIMGGVAQGAGQALLEDVVYDQDSGQLLTGTLMDYGIPRADTVPSIIIDFSPVPSTTNPLGAKGVGEGGTVASTPTVMNAILDALAPLGVRDVPMPATPERVRRAIRQGSRP